MTPNAPCPPDGNRPLYEGKYVVTRCSVDGSRQEDKGRLASFRCEKFSKTHVCVPRVLRG